MNKIQSLADQAKKSVPHGLLPDKWIEVYNEKFAELIVQECCKQFKDHPYVGEKRTQYIYGYIQGRTDAETTIKQHFGVEL